MVVELEIRMLNIFNLEVLPETAPGILRRRSQTLPSEVQLKLIVLGVSSAIYGLGSPASARCPAIRLLKFRDAVSGETSRLNTFNTRSSNPRTISSLL